MEYEWENDYYIALDIYIIFGIEFLSDKQIELLGLILLENMLEVI